jgi:hypothetical protein
VNATGWTLREIDELPFSEVMALFEYWNQINPPAAELVAAYLGFKPERKSGDLTEVEEHFVMNLGPSRSFDCLPLEVQQWVRQRKKLREDATQIIGTRQSIV